MKRVALTLSWLSAALALLCALGWALTFFGQNLLAALSAYTHCLLFFFIAPLIWYGVRQGEHNVMLYIVGWHRWGVLAALVLFVVLNFGWNSAQLQEGYPAREGERYVLRNRGTPVIRELTEAEYDTLRIAELRMGSGHPILFLTIAAFGWNGVAQRLKRNANLLSEPHAV